MAKNKMEYPRTYSTIVYIMKFIKFILPLLGIASIIAAAIYTITTVIPTTSSFDFGSSLGELGDFFNGITTPIFTLFAVYFAFLTFRSQQKEASRQRVENIFFQLLDLHNNMVNSLKYERKQLEDDEEADKRKDPTANINSNQENIQGRAYFKEAYNELVTLFIKVERAYDHETNENILRESFNQLDSNHKVNLLHYYRNLYQLFNWVNKNASTITKEQQDEFIDLIRAQLSHYEEHLLYFNINYYNGKSKDFKGLLEAFSFFDKYREQGSREIFDNFLSKVQKEKNKQVPVT